MTSSVVESSAMSTRSTPRKRPQMNSFVTPMRLSSKTATSLTPAAALAEIDTPPLVAFQTTDDKSMNRRRRLKRDVASSTMSPHSPLLACEQNVDDSAAILQRSLNSHLAAAAAVVTADASSSASICNAIQLPTWRLADDFVPHPTSRTTKALGSALRAPLVEPAMRVFADDDDDEYTALHARYELRERIVRALWIVSLPMRAQSHRDPRNDYRQVLRSHPDEAAAIVAENGVRLTKRARNALEPAVVESSIDIPAEPVTEPVEPQALPLFSFAPAKKPSVNRRRAVKSTSATTRRRRERDRLRRRRR